MLLPDVSSQLLAGQDRRGAYGIKVDGDQLPDSEAELSEGIVFKLLSLLHHNFVCDVLDLIVA